MQRVSDDEVAVLVIDRCVAEGRERVEEGFSSLGKRHTVLGFVGLGLLIVPFEIGALQTKEGGHG